MATGEPRPAERCNEMIAAKKEEAASLLIGAQNSRPAGPLSTSRASRQGATGATRASASSSRRTHDGSSMPTPAATERRAEQTVLRAARWRGVRWWRRVARQLERHDPSTPKLVQQALEDEPIKSTPQGQDDI